MYKIITHTIIEEHFDNPADIANAVVSSDTTIFRTYPDGSLIPFSLPISYVMASNAVPHCGNCVAYTANTGYCSTYDAAVESDYVCATWKAIPENV
jgi:hypothetical protein